MVTAQPLRHTYPAVSVSATWNDANFLALIEGLFETHKEKNQIDKNETRKEMSVR